GPGCVRRFATARAGRDDLYGWQSRRFQVGLRRPISGAGKTLQERAGHLHDRLHDPARADGPGISGRPGLYRRQVTMKAKLALLVCAMVLFSANVCAQKPIASATSADEVRREFLHAWNGYKQYAWAHDDLKPLSKTYHDWYTESLLMTPVDALDTMI